MIHALSRLYRKIPRQAVSLLFLAAIIVFLVLYLKGTDWSRLAQLRVSWGWVLIGSAWALVFRYWLVFIWRVILRALGSPALPSFRLMAHVFAKAWMARYIPGTITWIAGKVYMAASYGISKSRLAVSSLLEGGMQVAATVVVSLLLIGFNPHVRTIPVALRVVIVLIALACLGVLFPPVFNRLLRIAHVAVRKRQPGEELKINGRAVARSFALFAVGTFINGAASFFIVVALDPHVTPASFLYVVGAFGLAGAIGIAVPFLPSGLGVRDGVLLVLLTAIMPKELAVAITVFSRLWQVAVDAIFLGATALVQAIWPAGERSP